MYNSAVKGACQWFAVTHMLIPVEMYITMSINNFPA